MFLQEQIKDIIMPGCLRPEFFPGMVTVFARSVRIRRGLESESARWPRAGGLRPESPNGDSAEVRVGTSCDPIRLGVGRHSQRQSHGWRGVLLKHLDGSSAFRLSSVIRNTSFNTNHSNGRVISIVPQSVHTLGLFQQQTPNVGHAL